MFWFSNKVEHLVLVLAVPHLKVSFWASHHPSPEPSFYKGSQHLSNTLSTVLQTVNTVDP